MSVKTVLLVEDDPNDELLTCRALKAGKILNPVVVAHDGVEALEYLFGTPSEPKGVHHPLPELVLLDLKLPRVPGLEVLRRIRADKRTHLLPVVVLTSSGEERDVLESYGLGANSYVQKPVGFSEFLEAATQLGLYWMLVNKAPRLD